MSTIFLWFDISYVEAVEVNQVGLSWHRCHTSFVCISNPIDSRKLKQLFNTICIYYHVVLCKYKLNSEEIKMLLQKRFHFKVLSHRTQSQFCSYCIWAPNVFQFALNCWENQRKKNALKLLDEKQLKIFLLKITVRNMQVYSLGTTEVLKLLPSSNPKDLMHLGVIFSLHWQDSVGRCRYRFFLVTVEEFLHQCQPGLGMGSIISKIWST